MRHDNWQTRLSDLIEANREKPFDFVSHNCLLWAGLGIKAVTGKNPVSKVAGNYADERSALIYLRNKEKVKDVPEFLAKTLGQEQRAIAFARQGDIVFANTESVEDLSINCGKIFGEVPGVCYGSISYFVGEFGLVSCETLKLSRTLWVS